MLMAITLSSVRTGRCLRFSTTSLLINLLVGYDYLFRRRRNLVHLARKESRVAEHAIQLHKRVRISMRGRAEHHHAEHRRCRRRNPVVVRDKFERYGAASRREGGMDLLEQCLVGRWIEVMQEIR